MPPNWQKKELFVYLNNMKFKIDENLPVEIAELLRDDEFDAMTVNEQILSGEPDSIIAEICQREERAIVTLDIGFSDIRRYPPEDYFGIIVLRPTMQDKQSILDIFKPVLQHLKGERLNGFLWIVNEKKIRIRD